MKEEEETFEVTERAFSQSVSQSVRSSLQKQTSLSPSGYSLGVSTGAVDGCHCSIPGSFQKQTNTYAAFLMLNFVIMWSLSCFFAFATQPLGESNPFGKYKDIYVIYRGI